MSVKFVRGVHTTISKHCNTWFPKWCLLLPYNVQLKHSEDSDTFSECWVISVFPLQPTKLWHGLHEGPGLVIVSSEVARMLPSQHRTGIPECWRVSTSVRYEDLKRSLTLPRPRVDLTLDAVLFVGFPFGNRQRPVFEWLESCLQLIWHCILSPRQAEYHGKN